MPPLARFIIVAATLAAPGFAADRATDDERLARRLAGLTARAPQECIHSYPEQVSDGFGTKILYELSPHSFYVNQASPGCEHLASGDRLVTISASGRPCKGDIARTVRQIDGAITGSCELGTFTPYTR